MKVLLILNESPYGNERTYNGLRLGISLAKQENTEVRAFLMGDAVSAANKGQKVPEGYYNAETMLATLLKRGAVAGACGTCLDARGLREEELVEGVRRSTLDELSAWVLEAGKVLVF